MYYQRRLNILVIIYTLTLIVTTGIWIADLTGLHKNVALSGLSISQYHGFLAGDIFAMPLLFFTIIGLSKMRFWGYILLQIEMGTWIYSSIVGLVTNISSGGKDVFLLLWAPLYIFVAVYSVIFTYKIRSQFT